MSVVIVVSAFDHNQFKEQKEPSYNIVGTYCGKVGEEWRYFVFQEDGYYCYYAEKNQSIIIDEGSYVPMEQHGTIALESLMEQNRTIVCDEAGVYDFEWETRTIYYFDKLTDEIYYINVNMINPNE